MAEEGIGFLGIIMGCLRMRNIIWGEISGQMDLNQSHLKSLYPEKVNPTRACDMKTS
jgi:hypothetical protein